MLERMKSKVEDQEALAKAYGEIYRDKNSKKEELDSLRERSFLLDRERSPGDQG